MNVNEFPTIIDYEYAKVSETEQGGLSAVFKATNPLEIPSGFQHLETIEIPAEKVSTLPPNFKGVDHAMEDLGLSTAAP